MKSGKNLTHEWASHYGIAPKRENESEEDFENRVQMSLQKVGVVVNRPVEQKNGAWALMAIFL